MCLCYIILSIASNGLGTIGSNTHIIYNTLHCQYLQLTQLLLACMAMSLYNNGTIVDIKPASHAWVKGNSLDISTQSPSPFQCREIAHSVTHWTMEARALIGSGVVTEFASIFKYLMLYAIKGANTR